MNQHQEQPSRDSMGRDLGGAKRPERDEPNGISDRNRSSASIAPVAYQLEEEREEPALLPPQRASTFVRNVAIATMVGSLAFVASGVARPLKLPSSSAPAARVEAPAAMPAAPPAEAPAAMPKAPPAEAPSLERPASVIASGAESQVDAAARTATERCLGPSELGASLRVVVRFAPSGRAASVSLDGGRGYSSATLACVEGVFFALQVGESPAEQRTFVRVLGAWTGPG